MRIRLGVVWLYGVVVATLSVLFIKGPAILQTLLNFAIGFQ